MAIRWTQQYLEYIADADSSNSSDLRVTKVHAQVLSQFDIIDTATDTFNFTEIIVEGILGQSFDTLVISESATNGLDSAETATDTITYTEEAILDLARAFEDYTITEEASAEGSEYAGPASDTWSLVENAFVIDFCDDTWSLSEAAEQRHEAIDDLTISDLLTVNIDYNVSGTDAFTITEVLAENIDFETVITDDMDEFEDVYDPVTNEITQNQIGGWRDEATVAGPYTVGTSDLFLYGETLNGWDVPPDGANSFSETAEDNLTITESARVSYTDEASDTWSMTDSSDEDYGPPSEDDLTFDDTATATVEYGADTASDTWDLQEQVSFTVDNENQRDECIYTPFVGSDPDFPTGYSPAKEATGFKLQYPSTGTVTDEVILRNPNFGNQDRLEIARTFHESRGGTLIVYRDPIWPNVHTLLYSFSSLTETQAYAFRDFMEAYPGLDIRLIDQEGREWIGIITQPNDPIVQDGKGCRYTASFEFQGERTDAIGASDDYSISDQSEDPP